MADAQPRPCDTHPDLVRFRYPLPNLAHSLRHQRKTRIVALGSSSTAGERVNNEIKILPFPYRLELALRIRHFGRMIDVINRGISGQESTSEMPRLEPDVIAETPAMVIWQVGTNAVFYPGVYNFDEVSASIEAGIDWLAAFPIDVVLMDLQYTTGVLDGPKRKSAEDMVARIAAVADKKGVNLFPRFALMRRWCDDGIKIDDLIDPDDSTRLHMSDWATGCMTRALDGAIAGAPEPTA